MSSHRRLSHSAGEDWLRQLPIAVRYVIAVIGMVVAVAVTVVVLSWLTTR